MNINKLASITQSAVTYTQNRKTEDIKKSARTDTFSITKEAQEYLARQKSVNDKNAPTDFGEDKNTSFIQMEAFRKQQEKSQEKSKKSIVDVQKCMKIAARIMHGDKVPMKDRKFLAENQPELYKNALLFQRQNPEPKKYKSLVDDEDEEERINNVCALKSADSADVSALTEAVEDTEG